MILENEFLCSQAASLGAVWVKKYTSVFKRFKLYFRTESFFALD